VTFGAKQEADIKFVDGNATMSSVGIVHLKKTHLTVIKFVAMETQRVPFVLFSLKTLSFKQYVTFIAMETQQLVPFVLFI
jgi:hypothetical protein